MTEDELSNIVIGLAIDIHTAMGPGLSGSAYKKCLYCKPKKGGFPIPFILFGSI